MAPRTILPERNLDVLRAFAVLCVLCNHLIMAAPFAPAVVFSYWLGRAGVLAFFVHTSLVLMSSLERHAAEGQGVKAFYIRRAFRIYPLAIATVVLVVLLHVPANVPVHGLVWPFERPRLPTLLANLALVQNLSASRNLIAVLWTLPIELQMYAVLPLCYLAAIRGPAAVAWFFALGIAAANLWASNLVPGLWRLDTLLFVPCFMSGVLAYALLRRGRPRSMLPSWVWFVILPLNVIVCSRFAVQSDHDAWESKRWMQWAFCLVLGLCIPLIRQMSESVIARGANKLAQYSYGVYLLHLPALWVGFVIFRDAPAGARWAISLMLTVILSALGYHLVERPGIRLGTRMARGWMRHLDVVPRPSFVSSPPAAGD